jgi:flagellar basal-body rod modification protein FlgD
MYVGPITNAASFAASQASSSSSSSNSSTSSSSGTGIDSMFMQLLITQLQNQDPLSPMDPSTFVTQLVGVNTLDQVSQINQLLETNLSSTSAS